MSNNKDTDLKEKKVKYIFTYDELMNNNAIFYGAGRREVLEKVEKIVMDARMYADVYDREVWRTSTISQTDALKRAYYFEQLLKDLSSENVDSNGTVKGTDKTKQELDNPIMTLNKIKDLIKQAEVKV